MLAAHSGRHRIEKEGEKEGLKKEEPLAQCLQHYASSTQQLAQASSTIFEGVARLISPTSPGF